MATHFMDDNTVHFCKEFATGLHPVAKGNGKTQHHLAVGDQRQHVVHQMIGGFSLAFGATRWTPASFLATKRHYLISIQGLRPSSCPSSLLRISPRDMLGSSDVVTVSAGCP